MRMPRHKIAVPLHETTVMVEATVSEAMAIMDWLKSNERHFIDNDVLAFPDQGRAFHLTAFMHTDDYLKGFAQGFYAGKSSKVSLSDWAVALDNNNESMEFRVGFADGFEAHELPWLGRKAVS
jgi:hypothetical protein